MKPCPPLTGLLVPLRSFRLSIAFALVLLYAAVWAQPEDTLRYKGVKTRVEKNYRLVNGVLTGDTNRTITYFSRRGFADSALSYPSKDVTKKIWKYVYGPTGKLNAVIFYNATTQRRDTTFYDRSYYEYKYDLAGNMIETTDHTDLNPGKSKVMMTERWRGTYTYDTAGRRTEMNIYDPKNKLLYKNEFTYDRDGHTVGIVKKGADGNQTVTEINYSKTGNETEYTRRDANGEVVYHKLSIYDRFDHLVLEKKTKTKDSDRETTRYTYIKLKGTWQGKKRSHRSKGSVSQYTYHYILQPDARFTTIETCKESKGYVKLFKKTTSVNYIYAHADSSYTYEAYKNHRAYRKKNMSHRYTTLKNIYLTNESFYTKGGLYSMTKRDTLNNELCKLHLGPLGDTTRFEWHHYTPRNLPDWETDINYYSDPPNYKNEKAVPLRRKEETVNTYSYEFY